MKSILSPSLARRLIVSFVLAFILTALTLLTHDVIKLKGEATENALLLKISAAMLDSVADVTDAEGAVRLGKSLQAQIDAITQTETAPGNRWLFQLIDRDGRLIYATQESGAAVLQGPLDTLSHVSIQGHKYQLYAAETSRWSIRVAQPELDNAFALAFMVKWLLPDLLISFPLFVIPAWLVIFQGLKPLRRLSAQLVSRKPDDLSSLDVDMKYIELKPLTTAFNALLAKLRRKVALERAFVQDAAHELRTPMAVIGAQAHVLAFAATHAERLNAKQALDEAIGRASHLTQQLLSLVALEHTAQDLPTVVNVSNVIQNLLAQMAPAAISRNVELSLDAPDELCWHLKPAAFQSIIQNLVDNALRYGKDGGQIAVSAALTPEGMRLCVADDGPGIPQAEQELIFERFYRGGGHDVAGTGLGLAIVKKAALNMGGSVRLQAGLNGLGVGFSVLIPAAETVLAMRPWAG